MYTELTAISHGAVEYESLSFSSLPPTNMAALISGLDAEESIDNAEHRNFLGSVRLVESGGNSDEFLDPWGNPYILDGTSRTITCNAIDSFGESMNPIVIRF